MEQNWVNDMGNNKKGEMLLGKCNVVDQGRNRHIFLRGQSHFSWFFFPAWNAFSQYKIPILVDSKQISVVFKSEKQKGKKKASTLFISFPTYHLLFLNFPSFLLNFHPFSLFILASFFPIRQQRFPGQKSLGGTLPPPRPAPPVTPLL